MKSASRIMRESVATAAMMRYIANLPPELGNVKMRMQDTAEPCDCGDLLWRFTAMLPGGAESSILACISCHKVRHEKGDRVFDGVE